MGERDIRVLIVEDDPADAELIRRELERAGLAVSCRVVGEERAFVRALDEDAPHLILSDHRLPAFDGPAALEIARTRSPEVPFLFVSGAIGEEVAIEMLRRGATDYVLKDSLSRLGPAVRRALAEAEARAKSKQAEEALRVSEQKYRDVVENASDAVFVIQDGRIAFFNRRTEEQTGYGREELARLPFARVIHPEDRDVILDRLRRRLEGEDLPAVNSFRIVNAAGQERWVELNGLRILWEGRPAVLCFGRDVTEQRSLKDQYLQSQRLEAVGRLAGGVAHDFNNMLSVILGYADLLLLDTREQDPIYKPLKGIQNAAEHAGRLTRQLLAFSRKQVLRLAVLDLNRVVESTVRMLGRVIGEDVELVTLLAPGLWPVKADPGQMEQVLMNLAVNARDAMPGGGRLTLQTSNATVEAGHAAMHAGISPGAYVVLSVSDTGVGMDEKTRAQIFEPFFTTKEKDKGTGLGLSMVYGSVRQTGGHVWVVSEPGLGSTFKIYLPAAAGRAGAPPEPAAPAAVPGGKETVLLVEDEGGVREMARAILEKGGYRVLDAANAGEALLLAEAHPGRIDLVLTDVVMPRVSGRELAERLLKAHPDLRVLYMSGYTPETVSQPGGLEEDYPFIEKPFSPRALLARVREVLDRRRGGGGPAA